MASVFGGGEEQRSFTEALEKPAAVVIPTGIPGFDDFLGQGLPSGNLYLVSGSLESNSNLFVQQVLYNTLITKGKVAYYTVERPSTDIIDEMRVFGMAIQQYMDDGSWVFARLVPPKMKGIIDMLPEVPMEQRINLEGSLSALMNHFHESVKEGRSTAIHLPQLVRNFPLDDIQNLLFFMAGVARKFGGIHFLLLTEGAHDQNTTVTIKEAVDSVFEVTTEPRGSELENIIMIQKIRGVMPKTRIIRLATRTTGLATETIRRVQ